MTDDQDQPVAWNDKAKIACTFSFRCPKTWDRLSPTANSSIRHCSECDRKVYLALTEEDFRRHADCGDCVAVRVLQPELSATSGKEVCVVGQVRVPYGTRLRRV